MSKSQIQTIIITGAASGIGRALALECCRRGHLVYATDLHVEPLEDLRRPGLCIQKLDVNSEADIAALIRRLAIDGVEPDLLINNAGFGAFAPIAEIPLRRLRQQFETNVFSIVALCQAVIPGMIARRRGRIVNIGSVSGVVTTPFAGAYCASKASVHAISDALRMELKPFGIDVITVQPGAIRSSFSHSAIKDVNAQSSPDSFYAAVSDGIAQRVEASQRKPTSAEDFARKMMDGVLAPRPRPIQRIGALSTVLPLAGRLFPTGMLDRRLSRKFQLGRLSPKPNKVMP